MSETKRLSASIALTKLKHVKMKAKGQKGEVEGLFIPIDANLLQRVELKDNKGEAIYLPINIHYKPGGDDNGQNGFIGKTTDSKTYKAMSDAEKEAAKDLNPILGSVKDWSSSDNSADAGGNENPENTFTEDEEVPF